MNVFTKKICGVLIVCIMGGICHGAIHIQQLTSNAETHSIGPYSPWSPNDRKIVYTCGGNSKNRLVKQVDVINGEVDTLYSIPYVNEYSPTCGTASYCDETDRVVFIHGPQAGTAEQSYEYWRRSACMIETANPGVPVFLDARDVTEPFTEGALRGGTHCHDFSRDGTLVTYTYNDALIASNTLRTIGVSMEGTSVSVDENVENHDGAWFSVLLVPVTENPTPGSGELSYAYDNCMVDFPDGRKAVAYQGRHLRADGSLVRDVYLVDVPEVFEAQSPDKPLAGTAAELPFPPKGAVIHQLTDFSPPGSPVITESPRFWLSCSPDGSTVFFLARDGTGVNQVYSVPTAGGAVSRLTTQASDVTSTVSVHPSGNRICYICDGSVFLTRLDTLETERLTTKGAYNPQSPLWSHCGNKIIFSSLTGGYTQLFLITVNEGGFAVILQGS